MEQNPITVEERFRELLVLVDRLRGTDGCPWDRAQTQNDIGRYLLEECYEVIDALDRGTSADLQEELGDLLFLILFLSDMAEEANQFDMAAVLAGITAKMIRRHPHVFGNTRLADAADVRRHWEWIKREVEHKVRQAPSLSEGLNGSLPTLAKTQQIQARASAFGFDWPDIWGVLGKIDEELTELKAALAAGDRLTMAEEAGDLLFTMVNLCRFVKTDAEASLRASLDKFLERFAYVEKGLASRGVTLQEADLAEMDALWEEAKTKKEGIATGS